MRLLPALSALALLGPHLSTQESVTRAVVAAGLDATALASLELPAGRPKPLRPRQSPAVYFVDPSAPPGGDGSLGQPWRNFAVVNADNSLLEDATLCIRRGTTVRDTLTVYNTDGVTVQAYGSGPKPIVNASDLITQTWTQDPGEGDAWYIPWPHIYGGRVFADGVALVGWGSSAEMQAPGANSWFDAARSRLYVSKSVYPNAAAVVEATTETKPHGIALYNCKRSTVADIVIEKAHGCCFRAQPSPFGSSDDLQLLRVDARLAGAYQAGTGEGQIAFKIYGMPGAPIMRTTMVDCSAEDCVNNGLEMWFASDATIEGHRITECAMGIELWGSVTNSKFSGCTVVRPERKGNSIGHQNGVWFTQVGLGTMTGNSTGNVFEHCLFDDASADVIHCAPSNGGNTFRQCVIYKRAKGSGDDCIRTDSTATNFFTNNIIVCEAGGELVHTVAGSSTLLRGNAYYQAAPGQLRFRYEGAYIISLQHSAAFSAFAAASGETGAFGDPGFVADGVDYHLSSAASSADDIGLAWGAGMDPDGTTLPAVKRSAGIYQYLPPLVTN